jgi:hypothetical protein
MDELLASSAASRQLALEAAQNSDTSSNRISRLGSQSTLIDPDLVIPDSQPHPATPLVSASQTQTETRPRPTPGLPRVARTHPPATASESVVRPLPDQPFGSRAEAREEELHQLNTALLQAQIKEIEARMTTPAEKSGALSTEGKSDPPLVKSTISSHPGIDPSLIRKIYTNDFTPTMLPKLRTGRGAIYFQDDSLRVIDGELKSGPKATSARDFGNDPYIWLDAWDNYMSVCSQIHFQRVPQMATAMINFRKKVVELSRIFKWNCVLQVALEHHGIVCDGGATNCTLWEIPYDTIMRLCPFGSQISYINSASPHQSKKRPASDEIDRNETCRNFNATWGCKLGSRCYRKHQCTKCDSAEHRDSDHHK